MRKFDTQVQLIKYKVLKEVAAQSYKGTLFENMLSIPKLVNPTKRPITRCCIYKEHAILTERVKLAIGGNPNNKNIVEVIDIACDECPVGGYEVTNACRGCLAHRCEAVCPKGAISFDDQKRAVIDKEKCIECGLYASVCPYNAITNRKRPCVVACKVNAISMDKDRVAVIDNDKCVGCGACVYQCPFGAIVDKSYIINIIDMLKKSKGNSKYRVYAIIAPSIASQFTYASLGQVVTAIKNLGFHTVVEAALGADMIASLETKELIEKGFLTSSCCPAFVSLIKKNYPDLVKHISHNLSPMAYLAKYIKKNDELAKVVFIGPCIAKKQEAELDTVKDYVDSVMTFEELQAMIDSKEIQLKLLKNHHLIMLLISVEFSLEAEA
jgi:[FeFe] hydrogenase (group B1/B3)